jgi:hypothetical protein
MKHIIKGALMNTNYLNLRSINFNSEYISLFVDSILNLLMTESGLKRLHLSSGFLNEKLTLGKMKKMT